MNQKVLTPPTYRAQLAREALAKPHQICPITAKYNPKHGISGAQAQKRKVSTS